MNNRKARVSRTKRPVCGVDIDKGDATKVTLVVPASGTWSTAYRNTRDARKTRLQRSDPSRGAAATHPKALTADFEPDEVQLTRLGELSRRPRYSTPRDATSRKSSQSGRWQQATPKHWTARHDFCNLWRSLQALLHHGNDCRPFVLATLERDGSKQYTGLHSTDESGTSHGDAVAEILASTEEDDDYLLTEHIGVLKVGLCYECETSTKMFV